MILGQLIDRTQKRFKAAKLHYGHGTENARDEAAFLVIRGLGLPFNASLHTPVDAGKVQKLVERRIRERVPAAYLLREAWLDGEKFFVDKRVIVPRSHIAFLLKELPPPRTVLDLCTGSGCLAVLAARAFPNARVVASDLSAEALEVAKENARRNPRISLVRSDLFARVGGRFDLIICNPPYVPTASMQKLPPEYRWEPALALGAGKDGLDLLRPILAQAPKHLAPDGLLVCEVGEARRALEKAYPALPFTWLGESVFLLEARALAPARAKPARAPARTAVARRPAKPPARAKARARRRGR